MKINSILVSVLTLLVNYALGAVSPVKSEIYQYEPHVTTLTGILQTRVYPGPPNYESVRKGDRPNMIWLLKLPHPISMEEGPPPASYEKETENTEIHLILTDLKGEDFLKGCKGKTISFTGLIFHATTIHHPLPLLMEVQRGFAIDPVIEHIPTWRHSNK